MRQAAWTFLALLLTSALYAATYPANSPASTNNDDTCDIALLPAATLLLPIFEVDLAGGPGTSRTTIFTVTNVTRLPRAARVTLWTDYAYPVVSFNLFLTAYDVQSINLRDVIAAGRLPATGEAVSNRGELSLRSNPNLDEATCSVLPTELPAVFVARMRDVFTTGAPPSAGCPQIGARHANAIGYLTVDVVGSCGGLIPTDSLYFSRDIRFDNVLIGDYQHVDGAGNLARSSPMVHIRAIPEGGRPGDGVATNVSRTFYRRLQTAAAPGADRRQPLPSVFAARWIEGGPTGFETSYTIWREAKTGGAATCNEYPENGRLDVYSMIRFDENENLDTYAPPPHLFPEIFPITPATSNLSVDNPAVFPANSFEASSGWMWMTLDNNRNDPGASQNWVVASLRAEGRFSVDLDALALGNGCSPQVIDTVANGGSDLLPGPAPNVNP